MKNILVTGGAGFIAFYISKFLSNSSDNITIIDNFTRNAADIEFENLIKKDNVRFIKADMTKKDFIKELDSKYDEIYHLAAINGTKYFYSKPYEVLRVNIVALMNILEWVNEQNTGKFIFTSSSEAYSGTISSFGDQFDFVPTSEDVPLAINDIFNERFSYGGSKLVGELLTINYFKKIKVPYSIIRYHNIYGPRMGFEHVIPEFCKRIYDNEKPFKVFGGEDTRAFCFIDDAVEATVKVMRNSSCDNEVLHIGNSKEEIKITELALKIIELSGSDAKLKIEEAPAGSVKRRCPNTTKLHEFTGFDAETSLNVGVKKSLDWYLEAYAKRDKK